jgi:hypothetical protein
MFLLPCFENESDLDESTRQEICQKKLALSRCSLRETHMVPWASLRESIEVGYIVARRLPMNGVVKPNHLQECASHDRLNTRGTASAVTQKACTNSITVKSFVDSRPNGGVSGQPDFNVRPANRDTTHFFCFSTVVLIIFQRKGRSILP